MYGSNLRYNRLTQGGRKIVTEHRPNRKQIIATLRAHQAELCRRGVRHAAVFGSIARGDAKPASDIDIMIELDPTAPIGVFEYVGITQYLSDLFPAPVDVANRSNLKALVRSSAERDAVYAF
jgi:predicted nucleotidyltransferase